MSETFHYLTIMGILIFWPLIPLFWIPVHLFTNFFRRLGVITYLLIFLVWCCSTWFIVSHQAVIIEAAFSVPGLFRVMGWVIFILGLVLHCWTIWLLGSRIIGTGELALRPAKLETRPPFNICRHPTYLAHILIFWGAAAATGNIVLLGVAAADLLLSLLIIIPAEERELRKRFGDSYLEYTKQVPRLLPNLDVLKKS